MSCFAKRLDGFERFSMHNLDHCLQLRMVIAGDMWAQLEP